MEENEDTRTVRPDGKKIRELRTQRGWRVEDLAKHAKRSVKTINNMERGERVYYFTLSKCAEALGVPFDELIAEGQPNAGAEIGVIFGAPRAKVQVTISIDLGEFDETKPFIALIAAIKQLVSPDDDIDVLGVNDGSVRVILVMTEAAAKKLREVCARADNPFPQISDVTILEQVGGYTTDLHTDVDLVKEGDDGWWVSLNFQPVEPVGKLCILKTWQKSEPKGPVTQSN